MQVQLIVVSGKANRKEIPLTTPAVIGRSREADLTIAHPMISRQHCELFEADGLLMVRDLKSLNGTLFDNRPVVDAPLKPSESFTVGPLTFRVEYNYSGNPDAIPEPHWDTRAKTSAGGQAQASSDQAASVFIPTETGPAPGPGPKPPPKADVAAESDAPELTFSEPGVFEPGTSEPDASQRDAVQADDTEQEPAPKEQLPEDGQPMSAEDAFYASLKEQEEATDDKAVAEEDRPTAQSSLAESGANNSPEVQPPVDDEIIDAELVEEETAEEGASQSAGVDVQKSAGHQGKAVQPPQKAATKTDQDSAKSNSATGEPPPSADSGDDALQSFLKGLE